MEGRIDRGPGLSEAGRWVEARETRFGGEGGKPMFGEFMHGDEVKRSVP